MFKKVLIFVLAMYLVVAFEPDQEIESYIFSKFQEFINTYSKNYSTEEYMARFNIFKDNYKKMEAFNIGSNEKTQHAQGITKFFDMTPEEYRKTIPNLKVSVLRLLNTFERELVAYESNGTDVPDSWDWRKEGAVTYVKNEGYYCYSSWAFSIIGNLEGLNFLKYGQLVSLSEQQLVDCDSNNMGCNGGDIEEGFKFVQKNGVMLESDYPYKVIEGRCRFNNKKIALRISGYKFAASQNEEVIKEFLYKTGPLSIAINAEHLQFYTNGIINVDNDKCPPESLDHGVLLVGYGSENGQDYWIIKNSWGSSWGEQGYFRLARGKGLCGVNTYVLSAIA
jgi:C1A family cysteine protease